MVEPEPYETYYQSPRFDLSAMRSYRGIYQRVALMLKKVTKIGIEEWLEEWLEE